MARQELNHAQPSKNEAFTQSVEFFVAAWAGDAGQIERILRTTPGLLDEKGGEGARTALHIAAIEGHRAAVRALLARGADVHARCKKDFTPLHFAAQLGMLQCVKILMSHGANALARADKGVTPAFYQTQEFTAHPVPEDIRLQILEAIFARFQNTVHIQ